MNAAQPLIDAERLFGARPLLRFEGRSHAFSDVRERVFRLQAALVASGVEPGDRVLLVATNKPEWLVSMLAGLAAGAVVVPVNPALTASEVAYVVDHAAPKLILVDDTLRSIVSNAPASTRIVAFDDEGSDGWNALVDGGDDDTHIVDRSHDDPAVIFYTSGTTGRPKGVLLGHGALEAISAVTCGNFRLGDDDRTLIPNSLSFIYPLMINCFSCMLAGATVVLQDRFHPEQVLRTIERERVTLFMGVPTMFTMMLNWARDRDVDLSSLRFCIAAGSSLSWEVATQWKRRFGVTLYDLWGQTEGTPITSYDPNTEPDGRPDSCGRALPGCGIRVIDDAGDDLPPDVVGEVLLTGPQIMLGYYDNPQATADTLRDGWIHTGDLGRIDADGYLTIVGRKRDMIIRGGANIYPVEIEGVLYGHPAVLECAVIGVPDPVFGEAVKAYVVRHDESPAAADELCAFCRLHLADYKVPQSFEFIAVLPKGPTGKILKRLLTAAS